MSSPSSPKQKNKLPRVRTAAQSFRGLFSGSGGYAELEESGSGASSPRGTAATSKENEALAMLSKLRSLCIKRGRVDSESLSENLAKVLECTPSGAEKEYEGIRFTTLCRAFGSDSSKIRKVGTSYRHIRNMALVGIYFDLPQDGSQVLAGLTADILPYLGPALPRNVESTKFTTKVQQGYVRLLFQTHVFNKSRSESESSLKQFLVEKLGPLSGTPDLNDECALFTEAFPDISDALVPFSWIIGGSFSANQHSVLSRLSTELYQKLEASQSGPAESESSTQTSFGLILPRHGRQEESSGH